MKQVLIKNGKALVSDVPAPRAGAGQILVQVAASCISVGTEMSGVRASDAPLWKRALKDPSKVRRAVGLAIEKGVSQTVAQIRGRLAEGLAVGYSAAGKVIELGAGVSDFAPGERVAVAGSGHAMHAEFVSVPVNLATPIPPSVSDAEASTVTLGAIALQGVRRFAPTLGETVVVLGLGLLGQITVQLLKANGCRVIGIDLDPERTRLAECMGADAVLVAEESAPIDQIARLTQGLGADGVIITAAAPDAGLLDRACGFCRRKGRVVLVGDVPITIDRAAIYAKELDFLISTSYGPGRYDQVYEEKGLDYPAAYVRWTENRNMAAYLELIADGKIDVKSLIAREVPVADADAAYAALSGTPRPLAVVLTYPMSEGQPQRKIASGATWHAKEGAIGVGLSGASGFAQGVLVPAMGRLAKDFQIRAVQSATGHRAKHVADINAAAYSCTEFGKLLEDAQIDLVLIAGRHAEHAPRAIEALTAGKHVFTEKPLALNEEQLAPIEAFYQCGEGDRPLLMTGFNRRFSPAVVALSERTKNRTGPLVVTYRMNAGAIPHSHWTQGAEGGGRNIGEACHIYDLFTALTGATMSRVSVAAIGKEDGTRKKNENFSASFTFDDGSLCTLLYTSLGSAKWPKEAMEVYVDGVVYALEDYKALRASGESEALWEGAQDKGHAAEIEALALVLKGRSGWPIPLWQQLQATRMSFAVEALICGQPARS